MIVEESASGWLRVGQGSSVADRSGIWGASMGLMGKAEGRSKAVLLGILPNSRCCEHFWQIPGPRPAKPAAGQANRTGGADWVKPPPGGRLPWHPWFARGRGSQLLFGPWGRLEFPSGTPRGLPGSLGGTRRVAARVGRSATLRARWIATERVRKRAALEQLRSP